jgi:hypothetical protein
LTDEIIGANPTIGIYNASAAKIFNASAAKIFNASAVKFYNATSSLVRFEANNTFFYLKRRSSLVRQRWRCS